MTDLAGTLVAFCNPLLDITANVDDSVLRKYHDDIWECLPIIHCRYDLLPNDAILAKEKHLPLYEELVRNFQVLYTAGGSAQNTMRAAQWLLPPSSTVYVGCIGRDEYGIRLRRVATEDGLQVEYLEDPNVPTGTCACLITNNGQNRSLVANLGAANNYRIDHVISSQMQSILHQANYFYISGFFLTVSVDTIMYVAEFAVDNDKNVCLNLSAPFICQLFGEPLLKLLPYVDYLFGNESEVLALAERLGLATTNITEIVHHLSKMDKVAKNQPRKVIITQGPRPTIVAIGDSIEIFPVTALPEEEIVDTNGAGDAFAGGFLSQLVQGKSLSACIEAGHYTASVIIRRSGITFPIRPINTNF